MKSAIIAAALTAPAAAFQTPAKPISTSLSLDAKSKSVPFLEQPKALDGSMVGDVGFDPLGFSSIDFNFANLIRPGLWEDGPKLDALYWMREAEIKHGRICMLAVLGYIAVDLGLRFPGLPYQGLSAATAHDPMVARGNMGVMLLSVFVLELIGGIAILDAAKGSDRKPGDFGFDPLGLGAKNEATKQRFALNEVKNGRLAMLAFAGIVTQSVAFDKGFPYM